MNNRRSGFTLIELLVVISIIGVLSSIVLASLNSVRSKALTTNVKSNLKNIISQAEISYYNVTPNSYINVCTDAAKILTGIGAQGATASCFSYNNAGQQDVYLRWGATGIKYSTTAPVKAWSSSSSLGVVTWDAQGVNSSGAFITPDVGLGMTWPIATNACALAGGRLPTMEELKTLSDASYTASLNTNRTPPGFVAGYYWSSTTVPSTSTDAYGVYMDMGLIEGNDKANSNAYVRCVR